MDDEPQEESAVEESSREAKKSAASGQVDLSGLQGFSIGPSWGDPNYNEPSKKQAELHPSQDRRKTPAAQKRTCLPIPPPELLRRGASFFNLLLLPWGAGSPMCRAVLCFEKAQTQRHFTKTLALSISSLFLADAIKWNKQPPFYFQFQDSFYKYLCIACAMKSFLAWT